MPDRKSAWKPAFRLRVFVDLPRKALMIPMLALWGGAGGVADSHTDHGPAPAGSTEIDRSSAAPAAGDRSSTYSAEVSVPHQEPAVPPAKRGASSRASRGSPSTPTERHVVGQKAEAEAPAPAPMAAATGPQPQSSNRVESSGEEQLATKPPRRVLFGSDRRGGE